VMNFWCKVWSGLQAGSTYWLTTMGGSRSAVHPILVGLTE
jgi:hypothetical protein